MRCVAVCGAVCLCVSVCVCVCLCEAMKRSMRDMVLNEVCPGFRFRVLGFRVRGELQAVRL